MLNKNIFKWKKRITNYVLNGNITEEILKYILMVCVVFDA
jgi:hypothetical protein